MLRREENSAIGSRKIHARFNVLDTWNTNFQIENSSFIKTDAVATIRFMNVELATCMSRACKQKTHLLLYCVAIDITSTCSLDIYLPHA